jgi:hypothetical protein
MKKISFCMMLNLFLVCEVFSQYHPLIRPDIYWDVMNGDAHEWCNYNSGNRYAFLGDTTIAGNNYKLIAANPIISLSTSPPAPAGAYCPPFAAKTSDTLNQMSGYYSVLLREDTVAKKVFVYEPGYGDTLLYDFSLSDGDTLRSVSSAGPYALAVDSVRSVPLIGGAIRKIFFLNNGEYYIESIGGSQGLQFHVYNPGWGFGYWREPRCFTENQIHIWGNQCIGTVGINHHEKNEIVKVFPNPAADILFIELSNNSDFILNVMDLSGRIVLAEKLYAGTERINISALCSGFYIYRLLNEKQTITGDFIVVK